MARRTHLYLLTNTATGKQYVGLTVKTVARRWMAHCNAAKRGGGYVLHAAIRKYGIGAFSIEHVATAPSYEDALVAEQSLIAQHDCQSPKGYNVTLGGEGMVGKVWTDEERARNSAAHKGQKLSPDNLAKLQAANRARKRTPEDCRLYSERMRRFWSEISPERRLEIREKIRRNTPRIVQSAEVIEKRAAKLRGRKRSPQAIAKQVESMRKTFSDRGYARTEEQRAAHSARMTGRKWSPDDPRHGSEFLKTHIAEAGRRYRRDKAQMAFFISANEHVLAALGLGC